MDTPRKLIVRPDPGDVVEIINTPAGELIVRVKPACKCKAAPAAEALRWTDKLRDVWQAVTAEGLPRKVVMEHAGYPNDSASDKIFRKLVRANLAIEANGLVRRNPDAPPEMLP